MTSRDEALMLASIAAYTGERKPPQPVHPPIHEARSQHDAKLPVYESWEQKYDRLYRNPPNGERFACGEESHEANGGQLVCGHRRLRPWV